MSAANKFTSALEKMCLLKGFILNKPRVEEDLGLNDEESNLDSLITKSHDNEKRITIEVIAEPWKLDAHENWYSYDTIVKEGYPSFDKAWKEGRLPMNLYHEVDDTDCKYLELIDHYIVPFDCKVPNPKTGKEYVVQKGTWCAEVKWKSEELWKQRTEVVDLPDGTKGTWLGGLSIKGWGQIVKEEDLSE